MKLKIIMDSGKEYDVDSCYDDIEEFIDSNFYNVVNLGFGSSPKMPINKITKFTFTNKVLYINPTHVSSMEVIE